MFLVCQVSELVENFNIGIFSDTMNVINVKHFMMELPSELYLCIPLSVSDDISKLSSITENVMFISD